MDRDAIARARRRREFEETLDDERSREAALRDQIELVVTEEEGTRIDRELLELLEPGEAALLADLFRAPEGGDDLDSDGDDDEPDADEVARLSREIEDSRARQRALEHAVQLLGSPAEAASDTQSL